MPAKQSTRKRKYTKRSQTSEAGSGSGRAKKPTPKKQPGKGEQYAKQRRKAHELKKDAKKVTYKGGLSVAAIKNDTSQSATEKKNMIASINRKKGASDG